MLRDAHRRFSWFVSLAAGLTIAAAARSTADEPLELSVVTFNVLVDIGSKESEGVPAWKERRDLCVAVLREVDPDILGLQEPTIRQVEFLQKALPGYEAISLPKSYTDVTLLYKTEVFDEIERGYWWLSPTPEKPSVGFGNFLPRGLVWARLKHKASGRELYVFNTHFDNTRPSQQKMAELCEKKLAPFIEKGLPMLFVGDFNTNQSKGDYRRLTSNGWRDAYLACPKASADGRDENVPTMRGDGRIDHIFYHGNGWKALAWRRLESPDPKRPLSDHYPVHATIRLSSP